MQRFAASRGQSRAETRGLADLGRGTPPTEIAAQVGVTIATVRTRFGADGHVRGRQLHLQPRFQVTLA